MATPDEKAPVAPQWLIVANGLQDQLRSVRSGLPAEVNTFKDLHRHIRAVLFEGIKDGALCNTQGDVHRLLQRCENPNANLKANLNKVQSAAGGELHILLGGGASDGTRFEDGAATDSKRYFSLSDGRRLDFAITVRDLGHRLDLEGYIFRLAHPPDADAASSPRFLRIDMNLSNHKNEHDGLRLHLHPGNNDLQVPIPWMSPEQVLRLFLYGLPLPEKRRHGQA